VISIALEMALHKPAEFPRAQIFDLVSDNSDNSTPPGTREPRIKDRSASFFTIDASILNLYVMPSRLRRIHLGAAILPGILFPGY
jgi:hypothetical protein